MANLLVGDYGSSSSDEEDSAVKAPTASTARIQQQRVEKEQLRRKLLSVPTVHKDTLNDSDDDDPAPAPAAPLDASDGLASMLPAPKHARKSKVSVDATSAASSAPTRQSKPKGLVPYVLSKKKRKGGASAGGGEEDDNDDDAPFFTMGVAAQDAAAKKKRQGALKRKAREAAQQAQHQREEEGHNNDDGGHGDDGVTAPYPSAANDTNDDYDAYEQGRVAPVVEYGVRATPVGETTQAIPAEALAMFEPNRKRRRAGAEESLVAIRAIDDGERMRDAESFRERMGPDALPTHVGTAGASSVAKQRHQLSYMAATAQAREGEIERMWASGKANRQMAGARYGWR